MTYENKNGTYPKMDIAGKSIVPFSSLAWEKRGMV